MSGKVLNTPPNLADLENLYGNIRFGVFALDLVVRYLSQFTTYVLCGNSLKTAFVSEIVYLYAYTCDEI